MKAPSTVGLELLKRTARFLVSRSRLVQRMEKQPPVQMVMDSQMPTTQVVLGNECPLAALFSCMEGIWSSSVLELKTALP